MAETDYKRDWIGHNSPYIGSREVPQTRRDAAYAAHLEASEFVVAKIRESGELPWWEDPERTAGVARKIDLPADTPAETVRRALFDRRYPSGPTTLGTPNTAARRVLVDS